MVGNSYPKIDKVSENNSLHHSDLVTDCHLSNSREHYEKKLYQIVNRKTQYKGDIKDIAKKYTKDTEHLEVLIVKMQLGISLKYLSAHFKL